MDTNRDVSSVIQRLPVDRIRPCGSRHYFGVDHLDNLADRMRVFGQVDTIVVKQVGDGYEIVDGMRRWLAARMLGWRTLDAKVIT